MGPGRFTKAYRGYEVSPGHQDLQILAEQLLVGACHDDLAPRGMKTCVRKDGSKRCKGGGEIQPGWICQVLSATRLMMLNPSIIISQAFWSCEASKG